MLQNLTLLCRLPIIREGAALVGIAGRRPDPAMRLGHGAALAVLAGRLVKAVRT